MKQANELEEFDRITSGMAEIQQQGNFIPDMSTKDGYEASKRFVLDVTTPTRTALNIAHKNGKAYWIKGGKEIDQKKNELLSLLESIQEPHQLAYKEVDQEKKLKKEKFEADIQEKIDNFGFYINKSYGATSELISEMIQECGEVDTQEGFYNKAAEAAKARIEALDHLNDALSSALQNEAQQKQQEELAEQNKIAQLELEKKQEAMRLQQEEIDRKQAVIDAAEMEKANEIERQNRIESDKKIAECARIEAEEQAKQRAIDAESLAKQAAVDAENKRVADIEIARQEEINRQKELLRIEKAEAEKREANTRYKRKVHNDIMSVLVNNGIGEDDAKTMIKLSAKGLLPKLTINY